MTEKRNPMPTTRSEIPHAHRPEESSYPRLAHIEGKWYVASAMTLNEPIRYVNYYRIVDLRNDPMQWTPPIAEADRLKLEPSSSCSTYTVRPDPRGGRLTLIIDAHAQAEYIDDYPVICPKVRKGIATRWGNGRWEKALKAGWTPA